MDVVIRNAHPGPDVPPYASQDEKLRDARYYQQDVAIPWTVVADDLQGSVHQTYGGLSDPAYLIDADGQIAFYNLWTNVPMLYQAIEELMAQGGTGVVKNGVSRVPRLGPAITNGWPALSRGTPQSFIDLETAAPGAASVAWLGYRLRSLLGPLTLRDRPLPSLIKVPLNAVPAILVAVMARRAFARSR